MMRRMQAATGSEEGSALLLVVGASAALAAIAMALLTASFLAYEIAALEYHGSQARALAQSALELTGRELAAGRVAVPSLGMASQWQHSAPAAPAGMPALPPGCGFQVRLTAVRGPGGAQQWGASAFPATLVDAVAEGRCGRGFSTQAGRFAVDIRGAAIRIY
jgi:hypothetical protein